MERKSKSMFYQGFQEFWSAPYACVFGVAGGNPGWCTFSAITQVAVAIMVPLSPPWQVIWSCQMNGSQNMFLRSWLTGNMSPPKPLGYHETGTYSTSCPGPNGSSCLTSENRGCLPEDSAIHWKINFIECRLVKVTGSIINVSAIEMLTTL